MKLMFFTIAASLALSVMAAVPFYHRRDLDVARGVYAPSNIPKAFGESPNQDEELPADMLPADVQANTSSDIQPATSRDLKLPPYQVHIRVGGPMQHVGTLRKFRLYWALYNALKKTAEPYEGNDMICNGDRVTHKCSDSYIIKNIVYNAEPHRTYANNAHLTLTVRWSEIYENEYPGLRNEVYALIANAYRLMADDPSNCYTVDFPSSRRTTMCNVAKNMLVVLPVTTNNLPVAARVNVRLEFNGASTEGKFNCGTSLSPIAYLFRDTASPNIAKVNKWDPKAIRLYMSCQKETCFDVERGIYLEHDHWNEPRDCDPIGDPWFQEKCDDGKVC